MLAAVYGDFNVRNEVDVHNTTVGGHFNNTHFLTGDGGYIQILLNGYGGLMLAKQDGMQLNRPVVPAGSTGLRIVGMVYLLWRVDYSMDGTSMTWNATAVDNVAAANSLCLFRPPAGRGAASVIGAEPLTLELDEFFGGAGVVANDMHGKVGPCL